MNKNLSKYRMVLAGDLVKTFAVETIKHLIELWADENGVRNVSSGVIRCDMLHDEGVMIYSAHFDSSHWTGINFERFDVKNPGEPQTL
jgi:hypothetical protein